MNEKRTNFKNQYQSSCDYIIEWLNKIITNWWTFNYTIEKDWYIILYNKNRLWIIDSFLDFKTFYFFLLWIARFYNLYHNYTIDFEKINNYNFTF